MRFRVGNVFGMEDNSGKTGCGGGFEMISQSCECLGGTPRKLGRMSSSWCESNFDHYNIVTMTDGDNSSPADS